MSDKIRIVEASNMLGLGGTEYVLQLFCKYFDKDIFDITVVGFYGGGPRADILTAMGVKVELLNGDRNRFAEILKRTDVLHWHGSGRLDEDVFSVVEKNKPRLVIQTNVFGKFYKGNKFNKLIDYDFYVSKMCLVRRMCRDGYSGVKYSAKRKLLYNPVDYGFIQENLPAYAAVRELREDLGLVDCFVAGRIGRADDHKFDLVAIDAIALLRHKIPKFRFLLVGATEKITKYVSKLGLDDIVIYVEPISDFKELLKYYCLLDVFVAASAIGESFGMVIAEAMACGVPVVTISTPSKDNGQIELVDNGITGYVVGSYDRLICMAIMDLYINNNMASTLSNNSKNKIAKSYEASRIVYSMQGFILSKLSNNHMSENADSLIVDWNDTLIKEYKDRRKNLFQKPFLREIMNAKLKCLAKKCGLTGSDQ